MKKICAFLSLVLMTACSPSSLNKPFDNSSEALQQRSRDIQGQVEKRLTENHAEARGITWSTTRLQLPSDWLLSSSDRLWNKPQSARPSTPACDASQANCQPQFTRLLCKDDSDCGDPALSCAPLMATVHRIGDEPSRVCQYPSDHLLDAFYETVVKAERQLDIVSLSAPDGRFHEALVNALSMISQRNKEVLVRILYSGEKPVNLNVLQPPDQYLERLRQDVETRGGKLGSLRFNMGWLSSAQLSWNHAKIIIVDEKIGLQGGHNWWDGDYLGTAPVYDMSMFYEGRALKDTVQFIDHLWQLVQSGRSQALNDEEPFPAFAESMNLNEGSIPALTLGRLGTYGDNSSDTGLAALLDAAEKEILIAQQDIFSMTTVVPFTRSFVESNLFQALLRDVRIVVIQSNKDGLNYGLVPPDEALETLRSNFVAYIKNENIQLPSGLNLERFFCDRVVYAPLRYSKDWDTWADGSPLDLHAKLVVVDRAALYIGSQNLYPANLQEFGLAVFDPERTRELLDQLWLPMYEASAQARISCPE